VVKLLPVMQNSEHFSILPVKAEHAGALSCRHWWQPLKAWSIYSALRKRSREPVEKSYQLLQLCQAEEELELSRLHARESWFIFF